MRERARQAAERETLREAYLAAYRWLWPDAPDLDIRFDRGWWTFHHPASDARTDTRVRTTEFIAMKRDLDAMLERSLETEQ
jgi:hypothetical protein